MNDLTNVNNIKKLAKKFNFSFKKNLGQNFIINDEILKNMVENSCGASDGVIEIGAGIGSLTYALAKKTKKVVTFEIDSNLIKILKKNLSDFNNIKIINEDILKCDILKVINEEFNEFDNIKICANLPYYLTTELILKILDLDSKIKSLTLMIQKEVAERICAIPGEKNCGAITFAVNYYGNAKTLFDIPKENFIPQPKVCSSVIKINLDKYNQKKILSKKTFFNTVNFAFKQRRKTILNSLASGLISKQKIQIILNNLNIDSNLRAENLTFNDFTNISNEIFKINNFPIDTSI